MIVVNCKVDFNNFVEWSKSLGSTFNFIKCFLIFTKKRSTVKRSYDLFGSKILRVYTVVDLCYKLSNCLTSKPHINMMCSKAGVGNFFSFEGQKINTFFHEPQFEYTLFYSNKSLQL